MSLLPQRKKSAEEIAKLREILGIAGPPPVEEESPVESPVPSPETVTETEGENPEPPKAEEISPAPPLSPLPVAEIEEPKPVRSLKRSERIPVLPVEESGPPHEPQDHIPQKSETAPATPPIPAPHTPKMVRSLRKSEQGPIHVAPAPSPDSKLPVHRHSEDEITRIRRLEAISKTAPPVNPLSLTAHLALVIPGYVAAIAAAIGIYFCDIEKFIAAGLVIVAMAIAAFIFFKKPMSRHHAAFIAVMALFIIVFGTLYYFPNLQHGT